MQIKKVAQIAVPLLIFATLCYANAEGPPNRRTGAPGETTCNVPECHGDFALNDGVGSLTLTVPATFKPFDTVTISIDLQRPGQQRWGFELTVLDLSDNPVGKFIFTDPTRTQPGGDLVTGRIYAKHRLVGTDPGVTDVAPGWSVDWESPGLSVGDIKFYAAGNAADFSGDQTGDYIYTAQANVAEINQPPMITVVGPQAVTQGKMLDFIVMASDPDNTIPLLSTSQLPANASFVDNLDGTGSFSFSPDTSQSGMSDISFYALDGTLTDSGVVTITVEKCCAGFTGNIDNDDDNGIDIADLTFLIDHLFINFPILSCPDQANIDGEGGIDIADLTFLIDHLFINFPETSPCK